MSAYGHISVAIPMMAEYDNLPALFACLERQTYPHFTVYCCVNNEEGSPYLDDNLRTLQWLHEYRGVALKVIDRCTPGHGWQGKQKGVGWARKVLFDSIAGDNELIVSLDADTAIDAEYLQAVINTMNAAPQASVFFVPYYHPLSGDESLDRPMLRYECYMRHYLIALLRIRNPYAFTALGSSMVFPASAYRRVGGITPMASGEDFYLMQKFAKTGDLVTCFAEPYDNARLAVRPQGRRSSRVPFGTGPAIARGMDAIELSYPFYRPEAFEAVAATFGAFPGLYAQDAETPMSAFLRQQLRANDLWGPLRRNFHDEEHFVHACAERVDGLRILQFLHSAPAFRLSDKEMPVDFRNDSISDLDAYRNRLFQEELELRTMCVHGDTPLR